MRRVRVGLGRTGRDAAASCDRDLEGSGIRTEPRILYARYFRASFPLSSAAPHARRMVPFTTLCLLFNICGLLVIYLRLNAYLQLLRRRAATAKLRGAGDVPCDSGIEWTLASRLDDNVSIYTAIDASRFSLRFVVDSLPTGTAELMCLLREVDLIPTWNAFCAWGGVLRVASATELWVGAVLALPWPVPRHAILVHAQLHDRMAEEGCVLIDAATPSTFADALPAPLSACTHSLPIAMSVGRLTPLPPAASGPRTAADVQVPPPHTLCPCTLCPAPLFLHPRSGSSLCTRGPRRACR